ncbi:beta/gamma crystallin domain-containing protein 1-like isoform X2 [Nerophis ophidion]|uniref:beta/gamma crystallin domain-containing protein 1-like isoform X2 n=1 Tax=Nerophis ophidion TaxID=159077 RepID=UPI002AE00BC3|nr:beta/gamma crystallin domain-containing protein 1-like isoform X2 [Nerophis ophidion]
MSDNPEEPQSPGVLGRIGSWLTPWKGRSPNSPTENSSPTRDRALKSEDEESEKPARKHQLGEKEKSSNPDPLGPSRDFSCFEEVVATQSAHREHSVVSSSVAAGGGPREAEFFDSKKKRIGQANKGSHAPLAGGNSDSLSSYLTDLSATSSSSEQGVVWNSDQGQAHSLAQTAAQAQAGKRLHVYVEETSVTHCGQDTLTGQEVILTKIEKKLPVFQKSKSSESPSVDSLRSLTSKAEVNKSANLRPPVVPQTDSIETQQGVSQKLHKDRQLELEPDKKQTEAGNMGRKNSAKKKTRKNNQGDGGCSSQEKLPVNVQPVQEGFPSPNSSATSPQGESPQSQVEEQPTDSSSKHGLTSLASPGGGENETSCPNATKNADNFLGSHPVTATADGRADMEDDEQFYRVERKTETPESKRRSIKVSRSEVKLFRKNVPLKTEKRIVEVDLESTTDQDKKVDKDKPLTETDERRQDMKKPEKPTVPIPGRIAAKINLFERQSASTGLKKTIQIPRSADVSPARKTTEGLKVDFLPPVQRSKSADRYGAATSSPVPPEQEIKLTVKERAKNFKEDSTRDFKSMLPQKSPKIGITKKPIKSVATAASESSEPDSQGKLETKAMTVVTLKPDGQDTTVGGVKPSTPMKQHSTQTSKADGQNTQLNSVPLKSTNDTAELTNDLSTRSKVAARSGSRSKRRKSKEPTSPVGENRDNESSSSKQNVSSEKQVDDVVFLPPDEVEGVTSTENTFVKESDVADTKKQLDSPFGKVTDKLVNRVEEVPESSVNKDEPDTVASNWKTKKPVDKVFVSLSQREDKTGGETRLPKREVKTPVEDKPSLSQSVEPFKKINSFMVQGPHAEISKLDEGTSTQPGSISRLKARQDYVIDTKPTIQSEAKDVSKLERQIEKKDKETPGKLNLDKNMKLNVALQNREDLLRTEGSVAMDNQTNQIKTQDKTQPVSDINAAVSVPPKTLSTNMEKAAAYSVIQSKKTARESPKVFSQEETGRYVSEKIKSLEKAPAVIATQQQLPNFESLEQLEGAVSDSHKHEANLGGDFSAKTEHVRVSSDPPVLISAPTDNMVTVRKPTRISVETTSQASETQSSKVNSSTDKASLTKPQIEEVNITETLTSRGGLDKTQQKTSDDVLSSAAVVEIEKTDKGSDAPRTNVLPSSFNSDLSSPPRQHRDEPDLNKQTLKAMTSPKAKKLTADQNQSPSPKKQNSPRGLGTDDSSFQQHDAPSSWLDVDFPKHRLKLPGPKLSASSSESNLLDTADELDDEDFIQKIQKLCAPFSLPPRKHNQLRPPQPPFAMPAIREARFEKTFDPEEFEIGLRKKSRSFDTGSNILPKLQSTEAKTAAKPARASIVDRCLLISSLDTSSHSKDKTPNSTEADTKEEKDDHIIRKSRLEGSCVLSSLTSPSFKGRRNGAVPQGTNSSDVSPQLSPLSEPTSPVPTPDYLTRQKEDRVLPTGAVVGDSGPPFPSFNDIKLPDYLEKYRSLDPGTAGQSTMKTEVTTAHVREQDLVAKPGSNPPYAVPPSFPGNTPSPYPAPSETQQLLSQGMLCKNERTAKGFHRRPGKIVLFPEAQFSGQAYEIYRDLADATHLKLSNIISVKVIRGCWILYEKPDFQGRCIALEEGGLELINEWAEPAQNNTAPMLIGSVRLAVCDYSTPHIDLFTEPEGHGRVTPYHDDTIETGSFGIPLSTASIQVHSGLWLVFSDPGFQGMLAVLETGIYPFPETWGFPSPFVGSLKPLKMGGFKVENPNEVKALVYEKPGFEGSRLEIDGEVFSFCNDGEDDVNGDAPKLESVGSLKIIGGFWVGYNEPGFEGQQYILEEGEYLDCSDWGGSGQILSLRPIMSDFISPHIKMFSNRDFSDRGVNIDLIVPVIHMDHTGYGIKTESVDVISGIWVVFEEPSFCGESYILEKGLYGCPEDWGAQQHRIASVMPVVLDDFENMAKFKVQLFSQPAFQGAVLSLEEDMAAVQQGFTVASCKVLVGSWLAFEGQDFTGRMYLLEEGNYPDLRAMGCVNADADILSLLTVGFEFSQPSIILFERCGLHGKRLVLTDGCVNLQLAEGCARVQSVLVEGGVWILYEGINYRGAQILVRPGEVPDWRLFSKWSKVGSLRPLLQRQVHFRLRNRQTRLMMSVSGDVDEVKLLRIQEAEETHGLEQVWVYRGGHLHCKLLEECCLSPSGSVIIAGSRVGLTPERDHHVWSITPQGFIRYMPNSDLVLEVKGGNHYDKNQVILNTLDPNKLHQTWDVEVI